MNTKKLIERSIKGNARAQKLLYEKYVGMLYSTISRYLKVEKDREDILLQGFLKVFTKMDEFEYVNERAFIGWMKKIMINEALMFKRKEFSSVYKLQMQDDGNIPELFTPSSMDENELMEIIEQLPDGYKTVFLLHVVDGYSHKEIAENLNIAEGTSRSQFFKARNLLQKQLGKYYGEAIGT